MRLKSPSFRFSLIDDALHWSRDYWLLSMAPTTTPIRPFIRAANGVARRDCHVARSFAEFAEHFFLFLESLLEVANCLSVRIDFCYLVLECCLKLLSFRIELLCFLFHLAL